MSTPLKQYSEERIGSVWSREDHAFVCHVLGEIDRTVVALDELARFDAAVAAEAHSFAAVGTEALVPVETQEGA